ncbi:putative 2-aminoethylphosphonate ABC transporter permease subunit [Paracoccus sp. p4-l81]|uniref:putative 2-aminoethylphosphonate ABC transporter permease subunit n=1 Tax=Paracoccus sp. p4-l81 TaxID=3342806 RepID=UPI0035B74E1C
MAEVSSGVGGLAAPPAIRPRSGRDDRMMLAFVAMVGIYLIVALALPLGVMLWKSTQVRSFDYDAYQVQVNTGTGFVDLGSLADAADGLGLPDGIAQGRRGASISAATLFARGQFQGQPVVAARIRQIDQANGGALEMRGTRLAIGDWAETDARGLRSLVLRAGSVTSFDNFRTYFGDPALSSSIGNSLGIALLTTIITVTLAFGFAYALHRTCMPGKALLQTLATVPILVPSLLAGLSLVYLFGNQGLARGLLFGGSIYGVPGIVLGCVFFTFPHALLIISTALRISDARLYEAARVLRASGWRTFLTVTLPGARYGLISAAFVVFTLTITEFGVPKVVGGDVSVLAVDIYKQVVGQQNFAMGAVVSVVLMIPAVVAFGVDRWVTARQVALLSARAVPYAPRPNRLVDRAALVFCALVAGYLLVILLVAQYAALIRFWPYNTQLTLRHYSFQGVDGGGWASYGNSLWLAGLTAVIGTLVVFVGAYAVEKGRGFAWPRAVVQFLAMLPMAVPGMVLGLSYIFFFNNAANPLNAIYGTMAILVLSTITHFYTVSHLTALTALKAMDREFEAVAASLKQPVTRMFTRVSMPICLPSMIDVGFYLFVNAMTTVSAVVFLYAPGTTLAAVAALNMDDAGQIQAAAAMSLLILYTNLVARLIHAGLTRMLARSQDWRAR